MGGCRLIDLGGVRAQRLELDEPERHIAEDCWRDDWSELLVSGVCSSLCVFVV